MHTRWFLLALLSVAPVSAAVDFNRDIRPILTNNCLMCHGPDEKTREGELRLDVRDEAIKKKAIVPKDAKASKLLTRTHTDDAKKQMPPPSSKKTLTAAQKQLLETWIAEGASYAQHWAFVPPQKPALPKVDASNPIDAFVRVRLLQEKLTPNAEADKATLIRRVTLDLTGLPPTPAEVDAFLADTKANAYEKVVDRLLGSTAYGERMALAWLDVARFADTNGFNNDEDRTQWPWRDWLIEAFNKNMPYDRFIVEQLAGDLLPGATQEQKMATAFLRNQVHNTEGGIIPEEYRVEYVADRTQTMGTAFLGLSLQCARCHDHKYDPISTREYYQLYSFFNNINERQANYNGFVAAEPFIRVETATTRQRKADLEKRLGTATARVKDRERLAPEEAAKWERGLTAEQKAQLATVRSLRIPLDEKSGTTVATSDAKVNGTVRGKATWGQGKHGNALTLAGGAFVELAGGPTIDGATPFAVSVWTKPTDNSTGALLSKMDDAANHRGLDVLLESGKVTVHLVHAWSGDAIKISAKKAMPANDWHQVLVAYDGSKKAAGFKLYVDGVLQPHDVLNDSLKGTTHTDKPWHLGKRGASLPFTGQLDDVQIFATELTAANALQLFKGEPLTLPATVFNVPVAERTPAQVAQAQRYYLDHVDAEYATAKKEIIASDKERQDLEKTLPALMVMDEMPKPREAFILKRGQYDQHGDRVNADVPTVLSSLAKDAPRNRFGLAQWLTAPTHPLTARVAVNRFWHLFFGTGLVKTLEDFGITGEHPSHPELLDYLAVEFIQSGWDVKALQKRIVMSATYRQASTITKEGLERDPENRLLARGPRYRLSAETVRDNALAISGLLVPKIGGPSVKPYQPAGLWEDVTVERRGRYVPDKGEGLYRRSMYTFWKRTCPPPTMATFDAPNREVCVARRAVTNTPLQALVLLNDPTYLEAARKLAERMCHAGKTPEARLAFGFKCATARTPNEREQRILLAMQADAFTRFTKDTDAAKKLLMVGEAPRDAAFTDAELASWATVASVILNLDETVSKR